MLRFTSITSQAISICITLSACSSKPPPPPQEQGPKTWSSALESLNLSGEKRRPSEVTVLHELWTESEVPPPLRRVEVTLAETGVLAESNGSDGKYNISVGPGECESEWLKIEGRLKETRDTRLSQCHDQHNDLQRAQLGSAKAIWRVRCKGLSGGGVIDLHNIAVALAKAVRSPDAIEGEIAKIKHPAPAWVTLPQQRCGSLQKLNQYLTKQHITYKRAKLDDSHWAIWTKGMSAFGLSEIALILLPASRLETAESTLLAAADYALRVEGLSEGQEYTSGLTRGLYVRGRKVSLAQRSLGDLPDELADSLIIVDPAAAPQDRSALTKLALKLTIP